MCVRRTSRLGRLATALLLVALVTFLVAAPAGAVGARAAPAASTSLLPNAASSHLITHITYDPPSPNILHFNQNVNLTFSYQTTEPGGVYIFARPFSGGALTPNYAAHPSPLYPVGTGAGSGFFTISSGPVVGDAIRFQMFNASQTVLLFEAFLPVHYQFGPAGNDVSTISLAPMTPNILANGQDVTINFSYTTSNPGGVRIFARPFSGGALSPNYAASGSPLYATGTGTGTGTFTISTGAVDVDQIRFQMLNADQTVLLYETFIPVSYAFRSGTNIVTGITLSPMTPNILDHGQDFTVNFSYATAQAGGVRIFARPFTRGALSPNYAASGSPLYATGTGAGSGTITISAGPVIVDAIRFQMLDANQTTLLFEALVPVHYQFGVVHTLYLPLLAR